MNAQPLVPGAGLPAFPGDYSPAGQYRHAVQFYHHPGFLAAAVSRFVRHGLERGEGVLVLATPDHRRRIEQELVEAGIDVPAVRSAGQLQMADAAQTLRRLMLEGHVAPERFREVIGGLATEVAEGRAGTRMFGEMVALLWADGKPDAAIGLEELWDAFCRDRQVSLLCAYSMDGFRTTGDAERFRCICGQHSHVLPAESYPSGEHLDLQSRAIATLQQKATALEEQMVTAASAEMAHRHLAAIVESSDDAIVSKDLNGVITSWNQAAERIFGYAAHEVVGRSILIIIPRDRQHEEPMILDRIRRAEHIEHFETIRQRKDGVLIDVSLTVSPVKDRSGKVVGVSKIARDITARKRAEMQQQLLYDLATSVNRAVAVEQIYDTTLEAICRSHQADRAAILLVDADGIMRFKACRGLSPGYRRAVEGHSPWKQGDENIGPVWIDDVEEARVDAQLKKVIRDEGIRSLAFIPLMADKRLLGKFMIYYNAPRRFSAMELRPAELIATQVAFAIERQRSAEALEALVDERTTSLREAVAQMEEFSYTVSHDLRAPLRGMQVYSEALLEDHATSLGTEARHCVQRIADNAARLDRMVLDVLTFSRVSRSELRLGRVDLDQLVRELVAHYPGMQPPQAEVQIQRLEPVFGHEPSIVQAVSNLLSNAIKFVVPGTTPMVRVWTENTGDQVRLWIADNGIGIDPAYHHRLFRMFERVHPKLHYEGTGVGLAIVRKAVTRMGGDVGVESDGSNGSRFWIRLRAADSTASRASS